ncbi:general transcription factor IIF subunit 1-like [Takifugu rubripes]|uniref:general transcription factor IIF subunit 1-like n=1 Tax=Takifugu rubripes TaxID=31033 RepID=UPI001145CC98|nr:general transcription factor IIF subunit 1-like [Takifugu rubripes]
MTSKENSNLSVTEYTVRIAKNTGKKYNIMAFNAGDRVDSSTWTQAQMERDMSARQFSEEQKVPESRPGSEFGRKQCGESRRKKFGIEKREFKAEDQPWILNVNGKEGRRFKGQKRGGVTEHASYYIFKKTSEGEFEIFPVNSWYNFTPISKHRTLTTEEAEEKWSRRNKVVNHFNIMVQQRLQDDQGEDEEEESEKSGKKKGGEKGGDLRIHDLEEELEMSSEDSDWSAGEEGENKKPKKTSVKGKGKKKKRKDDREALEDSDDGDYEGLEVDYISDESSSEEEPEKENPNKGEDVPKGIDEASESEEESEEEKQNSEESEEEQEVEEGKKTDSSGESDSFDDSDIEGEATSALLMKKRIPPKRGGGRGSAGSSRTGSRPGTPSIDSASTSNTLRAAASKLEQGAGKLIKASKRQAPGPDCPAAKRLKMEPSSQSPGPSGKSTPQPPSGKSTPSSSNIQLAEKVIQRSLMRRPMTTKDILKKFQTKCPGLSKEQTIEVLQQIMKRLKPERKVMNDKMHFYLMK